VGAWGHGIFENDAALDWLGDVERRGVEVAVTSALGLAASASYLEVDEGSAAVAAAALVAAAVDGDRSALPEDARGIGQGWIPDIETRHLALDALSAVLRPSSELASLWGEGGDAADWRASIAALRPRIGG
jgi:hypothetical protein